VRRCFFAFLFASTSVFASTILVSTPSALNTIDVVNWNQFFVGQQTQNFSAGSSNNDSVNAVLASGQGTIVTASTTNGGISAGDDLLSTSDGTNGNGPLTLYTLPVYGVGAYVQGPDATQFTVNIQAFAGINSVVDMAVTSDLAGDPVFIGVSDSAQEITSVVYSLVGSGPLANDFAIDTVYLQNRFVAVAPPTNPLVFTAPPQAPVQTDNPAPEPGMMPLFATALLIFGIMLRKRAARI
jgi:hypothetical protein